MTNALRGWRLLTLPPIDDAEILMCEPDTGSAEMTGCEQVLIDGDPYLVQPPTNPVEKDSCVRYLRDCGHVVDCTPHQPTTEPVISWRHLSDLIEPADS